MDNDILAGLVRQAKRGEGEAFGRLYDLCLEDIYRYVYYRVGHRQDAEDVTEEVFIHAFRAIDSYQVREAPFAAWLFRIAHNAVVDHYRRRGAGLTVTIALETAAEPADPGADAAVHAGLAAEDLAAIIGRLTSEQQQVIILRFVLGYKISEVAGLTGRTIEGVKALQHRGLAALKKMMEPEK
jgi:RNA polymerase sigma-70 factor, ECF subfamily